MFKETARGCEAASGWVKDFGYTHECRSRAGHSGACRFALTRRERAAGAGSLDEQAAEYRLRLATALTASETAL